MNDYIAYCGLSGNEVVRKGRGYYRKHPDTYTGQDIISTSGWGKHGKEALSGGLDYAIHSGGKALMLGVDIYKLTAMHYVDGITPEDINNFHCVFITYVSYQSMQVKSR